MARVKSKPRRIDDELFEVIERFAKENDMTRRQASKAIGKMIKSRKLKREIIF